MLNIYTPKPWIINLGRLGRMAFIFDRATNGALWYPGGLAYRSNLKASLFHKGKYEGTMDLGSGLVTNVGATALANEAGVLAGVSGAPIHTLHLANWHATGTGTTAASVLDFALQTPSGFGGQNPVAGTQSWINTMAVPKYQTVATIAYTGSEAVTEWCLITGSALTVAAGTGTPFTAVTATTFTVTGTVTASSTTVQGLQQLLVLPNVTTTTMGQIQSNTTTVATLVNNGATGWWTRAAQTAGSPPTGTEAYTLRPIFWDHKVFAAINVVSGDSIQFTYQLTVSSGG